MKTGAGRITNFMRRSKTMTPERIQHFIDELSYANYKHHRIRYPMLEPHYWDFGFGPTHVDQFEDRFQEEIYAAQQEEMFYERKCLHG